MNFSPRFAAFCRNDVEYAPFGASWLRGVTPAVVAIVALMCLQLAVLEAHSALLSVGLTQRLVLGVLRNWARLCVSATPLMLMIVWVDRRTLHASWKARLGAFALATLAGAAAFAAIKTSLLVLLFRVNWLAWPFYPLIPVNFYRAALAGTVFSTVLFFVGREREAARRMLEARLARVATERQIAEARLQLLRAQIEPHFLFNSLASVKRLYEQESGGGKHLLRHLNGYLRSAVGRAREEETTLVEQVAMARSYLEIFAQRMGERLRVSVDVPADLLLARVPSLMLGTLVENAVKHGIGPRDTGGSIAISARAHGDHLVLEVADDGRGFHSEAGTGVGLANTRARLVSLFADDGDLDLRTNPAGGVTASIRMPLRLAQAEVSRPPIEAGLDEARAERIGEGGLFQRFRKRITWKHWAWAVGIGGVVAALDRMRGFAAINDMFGWIWLGETLHYAAAACLFMVAIVIVECLGDDVKPPSGPAYLAGWLVAAIVSGTMAWTFPYGWDEPVRPDRAGVAKGVYSASKQADARGLSLFEPGLPIIVHGALGTLLYVWLRNSQRAAEALSRAEIDRTEAQRKLISSRIEAVEAEVDPSFIFTTLETVESTYDRDRAAADAMLDELIAFLRAAIPKVRSEGAAAAVS